ncbi:hypothetical protein JGU71_11820 [Antrihabitans sp. YC3-6]|uniref:Uncharacterized protein n=1 Tax=Antrihabitans stalagmiti TaxID=2799499 RepID=A0A934NQP2_9NOCA|nr:hypothetical protein [Antrihabitans stalagmiti]MBJ8339574.1 hypothetical protein [Antrihabitans stalagmiti]
MPRVILFSNLALLAGASILLGAGLARQLGSTAAPQHVLPTGWFFVLTYLCLATAAVLLVTEWFSGVRAAGVIAFGSAVVSTVLAHRDVEGAVALTVRLIVWAAVACWFYKLAYLARADR